MNPKLNAPENLSSQWKPREPSTAVRTRLFGRAPQARDYSLATFLRWMVPATACIVALCVSIVDFKPGGAAPAADVSAGDPGLSNYIVQCLSDQSVSPSAANNRLAQISGSILEWTKASPSNSTKGFLLQTVTNSAMF